MNARLNIFNIAKKIFEFRCFLSLQCRLPRKEQFEPPLFFENLPSRIFPGHPSPPSIKTNPLPFSQQNHQFQDDDSRYNATSIYTLPTSVRSEPQTQTNPDHPRPRARLYTHAPRGGRESNLLPPVNRLARTPRWYYFFTRASISTLTSLACSPCRLLLLDGAAA